MKAVMSLPAEAVETLGWQSVEEAAPTWCTAGVCYRSPPFVFLSSGLGFLGPLPPSILISLALAQLTEKINNVSF
jgi:hypothetical protein